MMGVMMLAASALPALADSYPVHVSGKVTLNGVVVTNAYMSVTCHHRIPINYTYYIKDNYNYTYTGADGVYVTGFLNRSECWDGDAVDVSAKKETYLNCVTQLSTGYYGKNSGVIKFYSLGYWSDHNATVNVQVSPYTNTHTFCPL